jgi:hypothetical protein
MTLDPQLISLVQLLGTGPKSQKLNWTLTTDPDVFRLVLDEGLIRIERVLGTTSKQMFPDTFYYGIAVLDKSGSQVFGGSDMYRKEDFGALAGLYERVSNHLHGEVVGKIMNELQTKLDKMPA